MTRFLLLLLAIEVLLPVVLYLTRNRLIFFPSRRPGPEAGLDFLRGIAEVEVIRVPRPDGRLLAAYDARPLSTATDAALQNATQPVVIFFHGNAGNIAYRAPLVEELARGIQARIVMLDYSGYGGNEGSPSEKEVYRDGLAAYDYVAAEGVPPERIVLYGESLGGAVALAVAAERPCAGVVAQSSFSSVSSLALKIYPWLPLTSVLARGAFPNADRLAEIEAPVLVVHGTRDEIIPFSEGEKLYRAAAGDAEFLPVEGAGHNDFFAVAGGEYLGLLRERFRSWTGGEGGRDPLAEDQDSSQPPTG